MTLKTLFTGLTLTFGLPWLALVVMPYASMAKIKPVAYDEEKDELKGFFPPARSGSEARGQELYFNLGCIQCHTQVIRPGYAGWDEYKNGWGENQKPGAPSYTRATTPWDYLGENYAAIGVRRVGPDLANAGFRFSSRQEVLSYLYDPQQRGKWNSCPSQRQLFTEVKGAQLSAQAVKVTGSRYVPAEGVQIVPDADANALADYILALKKNYQLPASLGGSKPAAAKAAAPAPPAAPAK